MKNSYLNQLRDGVIFNNPTFIQLLGMCPTLAVTTSVKDAFGMGIAVIAVLTFSNLFISLVRNLIPKEVRIASYIVIISGFVTIVELLIKAYVPVLDKSLGIFIPLIGVNCIIFARAEAFASKNPPLPSVVDGLSMGAGFTIALSLIASVRELIGAGTICGIPVMGDWYSPATLFIMPAGAFLTLGFLVAGIQKVIATVNDAIEKKKEEREDEEFARAEELREAAKSQLEQSAEIWSEEEMYGTPADEEPQSNETEVSE
jgi:electron transport complex, RnfABCDGE type, E subunit